MRDRNFFSRTAKSKHLILSFKTYAINRTKILKLNVEYENIRPGFIFEGGAKLCLMAYRKSGRNVAGYE
jgi:hypothetical protein